MIKIKYCGLKRHEDLALAVDLNIDYAGFVMVPSSKRNVTVRQVYGFHEWLVRQGAKIQPVLVLMDMGFEDILALTKQTGIRHVQLAGKESVTLCRQLKEQAGLTVWKSWHVSAEAVDLTETDDDHALLPYLAVVDGILLDTLYKGQLGGTGTTFQWDQINDYQRITNHFPMIVAGGLTPENVAGLISMYRPMTVDVSSGIESDGQKDPHKMRDFAAKVREAYNESGSIGTVW